MNRIIWVVIGSEEPYSWLVKMIHSDECKINKRFMCLEEWRGYNERNLRVFTFLLKGITVIRCSFSNTSIFANIAKHLN